MVPKLISVDKNLDKWRRIYNLQLTVRLAFALLGPGYIHPDEHYQNGEVIAGRQLGVFTAPTWEWDPSFACRSIIPAATSTGIPYTMILRWIWWNPENISPLVMFLAERLTFFFASLMLDHTVSQLVSDPADRSRALALLASSYVMQTFQIRPFSNSIEAILVAVSLTTLKSLTETKWNRSFGAFAPDLISLAVYGVLGVFTRPTFFAFALPIAVEALVWTYHRASAATSDQPSRAFWAFWLRLIGPPTLIVIMYTLCFTFVDTMFFRGNLYGVVLTPLNFLWYNLSSNNLAEHGLHPRWLHLLVNLPLIVGPGLLYYGIRAAQQLWQPPPAPTHPEKDEKTSSVEQNPVFRAPLYVIVSAVTILSAFRHQEPRFLVPLLVPFIALVAQGSQLKRLGRTFWVSWIISNMSLAVLFGFLHQGGVVPSLINLHGRLHDLNANAPAEFNGTLASVVYWKTYMPPWHLLAVQAEDVTSGKYVLTDLAGAPGERMLERVVGTPAQETFVVAPLYTMNGLSEGQRRCFELEDSEFPHLDLDYLSEAMALGWKDGMTLGIFTVDMACLES